MDEDSLSERVDELEALVNLSDDKSEEIADSHASWLIANEALIHAMLNLMTVLTDEKKLLLENVWSCARDYARERSLLPDLDPDDAGLHRRHAAARIDNLIARVAVQWGLFEHQR
ncbi:hypothetical protein [Asticcacaulis sp. W401b]|uniref:hypothetical protein n=1 Tax=Asticcacaulis sp. W401b TaxID=3388666 RepID=UPI003970CDB7